MRFSGVLQVWKIVEKAKPIGKNLIQCKFMGIRSRGLGVLYNPRSGFDAYTVQIMARSEEDIKVKPGQMLEVTGTVGSWARITPEGRMIWYTFLNTTPEQIKIIGHKDIPGDPDKHVRQTRNCSEGLPE